MAVASASIHQHEVRAWDIGLEQLQAFGWTAAAAVRRVAYGESLSPAESAVLSEVWEYAAKLAQEWSDWRPPLREMERFLAGQPEAQTRINLLGLQWSSALWSAEVLVSGGIRSVGPGRILPWTVRLGALAGQPFLEYLIRAEVGGRGLMVRVHPSRGGGHPLSYTWSLQAARDRKAARERLRSCDAEELDPVVLIDNAWEPLPLAESVIAQLIDWHYRVANDRGSAVDCPAPAGDALQWWVDWLRKISSNPDVGLEQALVVAKRTVRPPTPAAHCTFWRKSLKRRSHGWIDQACGQLGVSRTTAYTRLRKGKRSSRDFTSVNELVAFLSAQAPTRRVPDDERQLVELLIENGMKRDTARKYAYRLRKLPEAERRTRLLRTVSRLASRNNERPEPSGPGLERPRGFTTQDAREDVHDGC